MNLENPNKLSDDLNFYLILSVLFLILFLITFVNKNYLQATLYLVIINIFITKSEFTHVKRKLNKHYQETQQQLNYMENKIK